MNREIRRFEPISVANIAGVSYIFLGLILGVFYAFLGMAMPAEIFDEMPMFRFMFGVGSIFILPFMYGVIGWLAGFIGSSLYNVLARKIGGIRLEIADVE